ncbi:hypothetical protein BCR36DRAFT_175015 [Piromyces finnis]|uniref:Uncharacterized protein n=1 Tax=Piromyces finnis TaxID=1754191 RepID=A0A1Y1VI13_9FUNG|nr:hypothetical protein BCR36DRAFT_175015 [Piromyces finnis]|eukprot:ORX55973.1 hypothetical protein BCR36DRAFT_175015 [Piromyces finnis]
MELSLEKGQLLNNLKCKIEDIIQEKTDFISKLNIANNNDDFVDFFTVLESFEKIDITKCFEINEIYENLIAIYNNELSINKKTELTKSFIKIIPNIELSKINVITFFIKLLLKDEANNKNDFDNEQTILDIVNYYNCLNLLIKAFIVYYYSSIDNDSFTFLNELFKNDQNGNNKFNEFNSKIFYECTQTFVLLQNFKKNNVNLSSLINSSIKKCNVLTMELLQFHIGNISGKYMTILQEFNNTPQLYKSYGSVCDLLISLSTVLPNDFKLLNLSWKYLIRISCSEKLIDNISKYFKLDESINLCYDNIKINFDKIVEFIKINNIKKDQIKRNITLIKFYFTHFHSLYLKHSNYISIYSIDESYPLFKVFINLCLYIKYQLSLLFFEYESFNEEQVNTLAKLNDVVVPIDIIFSHFFSSKKLDDKQKLNYIIYFIRFTYVDINVNDNYEKILSSDDFYYSKLLQLDVILRHFYQLSESIQRSLLFTVNASGMENHIKGEDLNTSILYCYFNCIDKCSADLIRHELPLSEEANEISTLDKTIITTLSLLPHYIHYSLFSFWEKHYFSMLIYYENQIIQTMLVESWCNIFKYLENNIQVTICIKVKSYKPVKPIINIIERYNNSRFN